MEKLVQIGIKRNGDEIEVSNSYGQTWQFQSHESEYLVSSLVALSVAEHFRHYESEVQNFTMSLSVEIDK